MEQKHINTDIFAALTVQQMLLEQLTVALFCAQTDKGKAFTEQFMNQIRYKMTVPEASDTDAIDAQQLQEAALHYAKRFFDRTHKLAEGL